MTKTKDQLLKAWHRLRELDQIKNLTIAQREVLSFWNHIESFYIHCPCCLRDTKCINCTSCHNCNEGCTYSICCDNPNWRKDDSVNFSLCVRLKKTSGLWLLNKEVTEEEFNEAKNILK